jgi:hypothetical protein
VHVFWGGGGVLNSGFSPLNSAPISGLLDAPEWASTAGVTAAELQAMDCAWHTDWRAGLYGFQCVMFQALHGDVTTTVVWMPFCCCRLMLVALSRRHEDDRDHYSNKRLDLGGPLLAGLFFTLFRCEDMMWCNRRPRAQRD